MPEGIILTRNTKQLAFFESWVDPVAQTIIQAQPDIDLHQLHYDSVEAENWAVMERSHGYQVQARTELRQPWFGDAALIARCPNLLAMSSTGSGYDYIDVDACTAAGVLVVNQAGTNTEAVAEHAVGLMLALSKKMMLADKLLRRSQAVDRYALMGNDILGKTVGIVGLGYIGARTAELCRGLFGMRVLAADPYLDEAQVTARGAAKVGLHDLMRQSDFISVHCPRSAETLDMFGVAEFALMKATAYFVNTARGGIHNEAALADALRRGVVAGAGIDVFLKEPPSADHPLLELDNVIATPHIAGITHEALHKMAAMAAEQWIALMNGDRPPRIVNPDVWPLYSERFQRIMGTTPHC